LAQQFLGTTEKIILKKTLAGKPLEAHLVKNNLFVIFKNIFKEDMENFEIKTITIDKWLQ